MYKKIVDYAGSFYQGSVEKIKLFMNFSPLELAVAGVPDRYTTIEKTIPISSTFYNQGIKSYNSDGTNVHISTSNGETITLHPDSVKHDSAGYVKQVLINRGINFDNAALKRLAKLVEGLRKKQKK